MIGYAVLAYDYATYELSSIESPHLQRTVHMPQRPLASLSLDLDNKWSYMKTHGDKGWEAFPSYLDLVVPRVLEFLKQRSLEITFFVVGQDAALDKNVPVLSTLSEAGHEIGNHSFHHEPWLHLYTENEMDAEIAQAEEAIAKATRVRPVGFRGPGFSFSKTTLHVLKRRGYEYDASTFPTFIGPLARAYYFFTAKLSKQEKEDRKKLFGTISEGFRPLKPYCWDIDGGHLLEIPVTTMPIFKVPIHVSYLLYLQKFSTLLARNYFRAALALCRITGVAPSLLLHPLDFLGKEDDGDLSFFPAMDRPAEVKMELISDVLAMLSKHYSLVNMSQHAQSSIAELLAKKIKPRRINA